MHLLTGLAAIFDGDKGAVFSVVLVVLLVVGAILLILNLTLRPRVPVPQWEPVADDVPATPQRAAPRPPMQPSEPRPAKAAPRRRA